VAIAVLPARITMPNLRRSKSQLMLSRIWQLLRDDNNRGILGLLGGGLVVMVGGIWTFATYFAEHQPAPINVTISDASNYVSIVSPAPDGSLLLANYIDVLVKLDGHHNPVNCNFIFLEDKQKFWGLIDTPPFSIPVDVLSFRAKFSLLFPYPSSSRIRALPFRVTCGGATSNLLSVDVKEKF
jgi:hypothetical protein